MLSEPNSEWGNEFKNESNSITDAIGKHIKYIHHIGSTAVPGLKAKPIIDIAIELFDYEAGFSCVEQLSRFSYKHRILPELPERHYWSKGESRTHKIHMYQLNSSYLKDQLRFRDRQRTDSDLRTKYETLKVELSKLHSENKSTYAGAKTEFINNAVFEY